MQATIRVLVVLRGGMVMRWIPAGDDLTIETVNGLEAVPYKGAGFWQELKDENQLTDTDVVDALLFSDRPDGFGELPKWLSRGGDSSWSVEQLVRLFEKPQFSETTLTLVQGGESVVVKETGTENLTLHLRATLSFRLPKKIELQEMLNDKPVEQPEVMIEKPTIGADFLVDAKSRRLEAGTTIEGIVKAFSPYRGCFLETQVADEQMRIRIQEYDKIEGFQDRLKSVGGKILFKVRSVSEDDGLIQVSLELLD